MGEDPVCAVGNLRCGECGFGRACPKAEEWLSVTPGGNGSCFFVFVVKMDSVFLCCQWGEDPVGAVGNFTVGSAAFSVTVRGRRNGYLCLQVGVSSVFCIANGVKIPLVR
jgi:hypothetical protein